MSASNPSQAASPRTVALPVAGQAPQGDSGQNPFPKTDNTWHLGYGVPGYSSEGTYQEVEGTQMGDQTASNPMEVNGMYVNNGSKVLVQNPPTGCQNTGPSSTNACVFTSCSVQQEDEHHVRYNFKNWGGRCYIYLRVKLYPEITVWNWAPLTPWSAGEVFIVVVPDGVSDPTVFGKLNGANIFFMVSDPLSKVDSQYFDLLNVQKVEGLGTVYRVKAKDEGGAS